MAKKSGNRYYATSLLGFQGKFPSERTCWDFLIANRWKGAFVCPHCQGKRSCLKAGRKIFECYDCRKQTSVTAGTIFHGSHLPLRKWFWAIFLMATSNKSVSALYLQKQLKIGSYRAAWLMMQKIRNAMTQRDEAYKLSGTVEADEIHIGGKQTMENRRKSGPNKTPFLIMVEETEIGGPRFLSFEELESVYEEHVLPALEKKVEKGAKLKADGAGSYMKAKEKGYGLERSVYMQGKEKTQAHLKWVNTITGNLKRFLLSTHHGVHRKYRKAYLAEFAYRFNRRHWPNQEFDRLLYACVMAKPVMLRELKA